MHRPDLDAEALEGEDGGAVADVAVRDRGLDRQDAHPAIQPVVREVVVVTACRTSRPTLGPWLEIDPAAVAQVADAARAARTASRRLALLSRADKDAALRALADALDAATDRIVAANAEDLERGRESGGGCVHETG